MLQTLEMKIPEGFNKPDDYYKELIFMIQHNIDRDTCINELYNNVYKLMLKKTYQFKKYDNIEDIMSLANIAFMKTLDNFNLDRNINYTTYLLQALVFEVHNAYIKRKKNKETGKHEFSGYKNRNDIMSLDASFDIGGDKDVTLGDIIPNKRDDFAYTELKSTVFSIVDSITNLAPIRREIYKYYMTAIAEGPYRTHEDVAAHFDVSKNYVSHAISDINKIVKQRLTKLA